MKDINFEIGKVHARNIYHFLSVQYLVAPSDFKNCMVVSSEIIFFFRFRFKHFLQNSGNRKVNQTTNQQR